MWLYLLYFYLQLCASCHALSIAKVDGDTSQNNPSGTDTGAEDVQRKTENTIARIMFDEVFKEKSKQCNSAIECKFEFRRRLGAKLFVSSNNLESQGFDSSSYDDSYWSPITKILGKMSPINPPTVSYGMNLAVENSFDKSFWSKEFLRILFPKASSSGVSIPVQEKSTDSTVEGDRPGEEAGLESSKLISNFVEDSVRQKRDPQSFSFPSFFPDIFPTTTRKTSELDFPFKLPEIKLPFDMPIGRRKRHFQNVSPFDSIGNLEIPVIKDVPHLQNSNSPISSNVLNMDVLESKTSKEKCSQKMLRLLKDLVLIYVKSNFDSQEMGKILDSLRSELLDDHMRSTHLSSFLFFKDLITDKRSVTCLQFLITEFCRNNNLCTSSKHLKQLKDNLSKQISDYLSHPYNDLKMDEDINEDMTNVENNLIDNNRITVGKLSPDFEKKPSILNKTISNFQVDDLVTDKTSSRPVDDLGNDYLNNLQSIIDEEKSPNLLPPLSDDQLSKLPAKNSGAKLVGKLETTINDLFNYLDDRYENKNLQFNEEGEGGVNSDNSEHFKCSCKFSKLRSDFEQDGINDLSIFDSEQPEGGQEFSVFKYSDEDHHLEISQDVHHDEVYEGHESSGDRDVEVEGEILIQAEFFKENNKKFIINNQEGVGVEGESAGSDLPSSTISHNTQLHLNSHKTGIALSDSNWQALEKRPRQIRSPYRTFYYRIPRMRRMKYQNKEKENLEDLENSDKNDSQMDGEEKDEEDKEVENIPDTSSSSTTTTTSTTTTEASTTTDEFSGYDEDEEEECNKDILDMIFTTIKCFFNMITNAIIGIEFGANCCHQ